MYQYPLHETYKNLTLLLLQIKYTLIQKYSYQKIFLPTTNFTNDDLQNWWLHFLKWYMVRTSTPEEISKRIRLPVSPHLYAWRFTQLICAPFVSCLALHEAWIYKPFDRKQTDAPYLYERSFFRITSFEPYCELKAF